MEAGGGPLACAGGGEGKAEAAAGPRRGGGKGPLLAEEGRGGKGEHGHSLGGEEAQLLDFSEEAEERPHLLGAGAGGDVGDLDHVGAAA